MKPNCFGKSLVKLISYSTKRLARFRFELILLYSAASFSTHADNDSAYSFLSAVWAKQETVNRIQIIAAKIVFINSLMHLAEDLDILCRKSGAYVTLLVASIFICSMYENNFSSLEIFFAFRTH